jgi:outer membrane protein assembly factor BamB
MRRWGHLLLVVCASLALSGCWPVFRANPSRTGHNTFEEGIGPGNVAELVQKWAVTLSGTVGDPVLGDDGVFVNTNSPSFGSALHARNRDTGGELWPAKTASGTRSAPGVANSVVFSGIITSNGSSGATGFQEAYRADTGALVWRAGPAGVSSPVEHAGIVYAEAGEQNEAGVFTGFFGWDAATGDNLMNTVRTGTRTPPFSSPALADDVLYMGAQDRVEAYDATGQSCPEFDGRRTCRPIGTATTGGEVHSTPAIENNVLYVGSDDGALYAYNTRSSSCGPGLCGLRWKATTGGPVISSPAVADGVVYVGSSDGKLYAFNAAGCGTATCAPLWTAATGGPVKSSPAVANGVVYVGSDDGKLYAFNAAGCGAATCPPAWSVSLGSAVRSSPAVSNGVVFIGADGGQLRAYGLPPD